MGLPRMALLGRKMGIEFARLNLTKYLFVRVKAC